MVLLKNENHLLPLAEGTRIALFGKGSFDYVKGGGGSGDVMVSYVHNLYDGLKMQKNAVQIYEPLSAFYKADIQHQYEKVAVPGMTVEPELTAELADGAKAFGCRPGCNQPFFRRRLGSFQRGMQQRIQSMGQ